MAADEAPAAGPAAGAAGERSVVFAEASGAFGERTQLLALLAGLARDALGDAQGVP